MTPFPIRKGIFFFTRCTCSVPPLCGGSRFGQYPENQAFAWKGPSGRRTSKCADRCRDGQKRPFRDGN